MMKAFLSIFLVLLLSGSAYCQYQQPIVILHSPYGQQTYRSQYGPYGSYINIYSTGHNTRFYTPPRINVIDRYNRYHNPLHSQLFLNLSSGYYSFGYYNNRW